jgi:O-antigen/teichoic acid export membrane protein
MKNMKDSEKVGTISKDHRKFAKNAFYSLFNSYGIFIFQIIITFFMARLISKESWGFLILAMSYINIVSLILSFFPPALNFSLNYYIPRYVTLNQNNKLKSMIKAGLYLKTIFALIIFFISVIIFYILKPFFAISLLGYTNLLFLLSPLIFIIGLSTLLDSIYQGLFKYKLIFLLTLLKFSFYISALIICLISGITNLELIALINLFSYLIPFLFSCLIFIKIYLKIKPTEEPKDSFKNVLSKITKYGTPLSINVFLNETWKQLQTPIIGGYETLSTITGFTISKYYSQISLTAAASFSNPLITSFSSLDVKNEHNQIVQIYNMTFKYSLFLMLLISGSLFILADFFLVVYGESYLIYSTIVKLYLISIIFTVLGNIFVPLLNAKNKIKILPILTSINLLIMIPSFFIGLVFYGIVGAIIGIIISKFMVFLVQLLASIKIGNVKIKINKIFFQYLIFFISLFSAVFFEEILFREIRINVLQNLNLLFFKNLEVLGLISFLIMYFLLNLLFKIFSPKEIELLEALVSADKFPHRVIKRLLNFLKKILKKR